LATDEKNVLDNDAYLHTPAVQKKERERERGNSRFEIIFLKFNKFWENNINMSSFYALSRAKAMNLKISKQLVI
jgi:hypothetical protein